MAGDWIKIEHALPTKPEVGEMADMLEVSDAEMVGCLVRFWSWVDVNFSHDCPAVYGTTVRIDSTAGRTGFAEAMIAVGWLQLDGDQVRIPNYDDHLSESAKKRGVEAKRKRKQRDKKSRPTRDNGPASGGQNAGPEKRRGEKRREELVDETSRDDHLVSWSKEFSNRVVTYVTDTFLDCADPPFVRTATGPGGVPRLPDEDRELLMKVAALRIAGKIPEATVIGCCEAIRHRQGGRPVKPGAYFLETLRDLGGEKKINRLLAQVAPPARGQGTGDRGQGNASGRPTQPPTPNPQPPTPNP